MHLYPRFPPVYHINSNYYLETPSSHSVDVCDPKGEPKSIGNMNSLLCRDKNGNFEAGKRLVCIGGMREVCEAQQCADFRFNCPNVKFDFLDPFGRLISTCSDSCEDVEPEAITYIPEVPIRQHPKYFVVRQPAGVTIPCYSIPQPEGYLNLLCDISQGVNMNCNGSNESICSAKFCDVFPISQCNDGIDVYDSSGRIVNTCYVTANSICESIYRKAPIPSNPKSNFLVQQYQENSLRFYDCDVSDRVGLYHNILCEFDSRFDSSARFDCFGDVEPCAATWSTCEQVPDEYCVEGLEVYSGSVQETPILKCRAMDCHNGGVSRAPPTELQYITAVVLSFMVI